jgi:hypothetical protein
VRNELKLLVIALLAFSLASATTVIPMTVEQMTHAANYVVEGQALRTWTQWNPEHTIIFTLAEFRVSRALKGAPPSRIVVRQMGGRADGLVQKVAGVRLMSAGEQAVLFVRPSVANDGSFAVVGLMQGNFRMKQVAGGETYVSNDVSGISAATRSGIATYTGSPMTLRQLEARVRKAVLQ